MLGREIKLFIRDHIIFALYHCMVARLALFLFNTRLYSDLCTRLRFMHIQTKLVH